MRPGRSQARWQRAATRTTSTRMTGRCAEPVHRPPRPSRMEPEAVTTPVPRENPGSNGQREDVMTIVDRQPVPLQHVDRLFIGGTWVEPGAGRGDRRDRSGDRGGFLRVPAAGASDVPTRWPRPATPSTGPADLSHAERGDYLRQLGKAVSDRAPDLGQIWPRESGALYKVAVPAGRSPGCPSTTMGRWPIPTPSRSWPSPPGVVSSASSSVSRLAWSARSSRGTPRWGSSATRSRRPCWPGAR